MIGSEKENLRDNISNHNKKGSGRFNKFKVGSNPSSGKLNLVASNIRENHDYSTLKKNLIERTKDNDGRKTRGSPFQGILKYLLL